MRKLLLLLLCGICSLGGLAQSNRIKELKRERERVWQDILKSEQQLTTTSKDVAGQLNSLATLTGQIDVRKRYIQLMTDDLESISLEIGDLEKELIQLEDDLKDKKQKYEASVQYLRNNKTVEEKLLFILSAQNLSQTYRRLRYVNEYATYQRLQGEEILAKQSQIAARRDELEETKNAKEQLLKEREVEQEKLLLQEQEQRVLVASLKNKQKGLQIELDKQRREAGKLNNQINKLIADEIERSRKEAEAEALRSAKGGKKLKPEGNLYPKSEFKLSMAERQLSTSFVNNRGKLPIPVTGPYVIVSRYGQNTIDGLGNNVRLDNQGIDIQTQRGAQARAIFDGEVSGVFLFQGTGMYNVLIRHGNYISVYCNLSSASVKKGDKVKTRQTIGVISLNQRTNRTVLHFQLRKETELMNPEIWLKR